MVSRKRRCSNGVRFLRIEADREPRQGNTSSRAHLILRSDEKESIDSVYKNARSGVLFNI